MPVKPMPNAGQQKLMLNQQRQVAAAMNARQAAQQRQQALMQRVRSPLPKNVGIRGGPAPIASPAPMPAPIASPAPMPAPQPANDILNAPMPTPVVTPAPGAGYFGSSNPMSQDVVFNAGPNPYENNQPAAVDYFSGPYQGLYDQFVQSQNGPGFMNMMVQPWQQQENADMLTAFQNRYNQQNAVTGPVAPTPTFGVTPGVQFGLNTVSGSTQSQPGSLFNTTQPTFSPAG